MPCDGNRNMRRLNFVGKKFGMLTVIASIGANRHRQWCWRVRCQCGKEWSVQSAHLTMQHGTHGCRSCSMKEKNTTHGMTRHPLYKVWQMMRQRCQNPARPDWKYYGARGIKVCKRWDKSFLNFFKDMNLTYRSGLTLDRVDNNGNYCKRNCRWATRSEQNSNRRKYKK